MTSAGMEGYSKSWFLDKIGIFVLALLFVMEFPICTWTFAVIGLVLLDGISQIKCSLNAWN